MRYSTLVFISLISITLFIAIAFGVYFNIPFFTNIDSYLYSLSITDSWQSFFSKITILGNPLPAFFIIFGISIILILRKKIGDVYLLIISSGIGLSFSSLFKGIFKKERPEIGLIEESSFSFPSNHATIIVIIALSLIFSIFKSIKKLFWRRVFIILTIIISLLVCISRFIIDVHWLSDVVAGIALGTASFFISSIFLYNHKR